MKTLSSELEELKRIIGHSPQQQSTFDSLVQGLQNFKIVSDSLVNLVRANHSEVITRIVFSSNDALRADLSSKIERIKAVEKMLLIQRQVANAQSIKAFKNVFIFLLVGISALLAATFFFFRYNFNKSQKAQEELTRANVLFEKVFYESPTAIVISELESGRILNCNRIFARTVNYEINELLGKTPVDLGIFESDEHRKQIIEEANRNGMTRHTEAYIKPKNSERLYVSIDAHVVPLFDKKCLLTAILDLTTHKRAEDEKRWKVRLPPFRARWTGITKQLKKWSQFI